MNLTTIRFTVWLKAAILCKKLIIICGVENVRKITRYS